MKNTYIVTILVVIAIILGFFWFTKNKGILNPLTSNEASSIEGCYLRRLEKDVYTLVIQYEKRGNVSGALAYNNYQKDSSSGSFAGTFANDILLGNYSFDSEGMHSDRQVIFKKVGNNFIQGFGPVKVVGSKEEFTDLTAVTYDPKSTFVQNKNCIENFSDANDTFTFSYNPFFHAFPGENLPTQDWRVGAKQKGMILANVIAQRTFLPKTNFSDARLKIGRSNEMEEITSCTAGGNGETKDGTKNIGGYSFSKFQLNEAAAGNRYETTSYRGIVDGDCYVVEYTIHSTNLGNYSPDQGIREFDRQKIQNEMEKIISSMKFIINSD